MCWFVINFSNNLAVTCYVQGKYWLQFNFTCMHTYIHTFIHSDLYGNLELLMYGYNYINGLLMDVLIFMYNIYQYMAMNAPIILRMNKCQIFVCTKYRVENGPTATQKVFMNNDLVAAQETFQRSNLKNLKKFVASEFMNVWMLDIFNQVNYFIETTIIENRCLDIWIRYLISIHLITNILFVSLVMENYAFVENSTWYLKYFNTYFHRGSMK